MTGRGWCVRAVVVMSGVAGIALARPTQVATAARSGDALTLVATGEKASAKGDYRAADTAWRAALNTDPECVVAARQLRALYDKPNVDLPIDDAGLKEALAQVGPGFTQTQSRNFIVLSDCDRNWSNAKTQLLERTYHQFFRVMGQLGLEPVPPRHKLLCILINDHDAYASFARTNDAIDAPWVAGYYATLTNRVVFYNDATGPGYELASKQLDKYELQARQARTDAASARRKKQTEAATQLTSQADQILAHVDHERQRLAGEARSNSDAKTIHEAAHLISFNCGLQTRSHQFPFWITEGLAVTFETENPGAAFGPDRVFTSRDEEFQKFRRENRLIPLEAFVQMNAVPADDPDAAGIMYAQAGALFRHLFRVERDALAGYFRDMKAREGGFTTPQVHLQMFKARFGDPDQAERRWMAMLDR